MERHCWRPQPIVDGHTKRQEGNDTRFVTLEMHSPLQDISLLPICKDFWCISKVRFWEGHIKAFHFWTAGRGIFQSVCIRSFSSMDQHWKLLPLSCSRFLSVPPISYLSFFFNHKQPSQYPKPLIVCIAPYNLYWLFPRRTLSLSLWLITR